MNKHVETDVIVRARFKNLSYILDEQPDERM